MVVADAAPAALARQNGRVTTSSSARRRRRRRVLRRRRFVAVLIAVAVIAVIATLALTRPGDADADAPGSPAPASTAAVTPGATATATTTAPSPEPTSSPAPALCDRAGVRSALKNGTDDEVVAAVGGGDEFRAAVASGEAPCLDLAETGRFWLVVNKRRALEPIDYWPTPQAQPSGIRVVAGGGWLRADVAAAVDDLAADIVADGAGTLAVDSAFRPYGYQVDLYNRYVASRGRESADLRSARPGHSEHQTGLAVDVVACGSAGCGTHDGFRGTPQAQWLVDNAWRHGFVIRYEEGQTVITGYSWEPWHLRYLGRDLAAAYHEGGYRTLEEFFELGAAPDYNE